MSIAQRSRILVTGGAGFIGSALVDLLISETDAEIGVIDKLTYAASEMSLTGVRESPRFSMYKIDICDAPAVARIFQEFRPTSVIHLAAETHVDRSITGSQAFIDTNIVGTYVLLEAARIWLASLAKPDAEKFRFLHVSTDEVFGSLGPEGAFSEVTPYDPSSPYSASKAASDHLVLAWHRTYGLPAMISNCSNNYGPRQFPEKLIPLMILNAMEGKPLPVYGNGQQIRDWLFVEDHARALWCILERGRPGETYAVGGRAERRNIDIVETVCALIVQRGAAGEDPRNNIRFVEDRPGHDKRYAIDPSKIEKELGWRPSMAFEDGLAITVAWYLDNQDWWLPLRDRVYSGDRLGLLAE